jgi:hypothetical protein
MPALTKVSRREPYLSGSPQYTPWENNGDELVQHDGNVFVSQIVRQSAIPSRPSRWRPVFFLQPTGNSGRWGDWWAAAFLTEKEIFPNQRDTTAGGWMMQDQRRNIGVPPTESFGDAVGEMNGYAPYGLDDGYD